MTRDPLPTMTHVSLFTGIGGLDLAAEWAGFDTVLQVERDPYCLRVLDKHWPGVKRITDIREVNADAVDRPVTVVSGGFPCQPFSHAGKRRGTEDDRYLWPEMLRAIHDLNPSWVIAENVPGLLSIDDGLVFAGVLSDLESAGYETLPLVYPACGVGANHRRTRVFIVAFSERVGRRRRDHGNEAGHDGALQTEGSGAGNQSRILAHTYREGSQGRDGAIMPERSGQQSVGKGGTFMADTERERLYAGTHTGIYLGEKSTGPRYEHIAGSGWWQSEPDVGRVVARVSDWLDKFGGIDVDKVLCEMRKIDGTTTLEEWETGRNFSKASLLLQSLLWRLAHGSKQGAHKECIEEARTKGIPETTALRELWRDERIATASSKSQRCLICGNPLSEVPYGSGFTPRPMGKISERINRLRALGNAVVPQQAYPIFNAIAEAEHGQTRTAPHHHRMV